MKTLPLLVAALLAASPALAEEPGIIQSPAYKECIALSSSNPAQALVKADAWLAIDTGVPAHHCRAMALYGLKRYDEAGEALNRLHRLIPKENIELRSFVSKQASAAWINANRAEAGYAALDLQLGELDQSFGNNALAAKLTAELLLERARLNITYGKPKLAVKDLDRAISLTPLNANLLAERGIAFEMLNDYPLARADVQAALTLSSGHEKARALLNRLDAKKSD